MTDYVATRIDHIFNNNKLVYLCSAKSVGVIWCVSTYHLPVFTSVHPRRTKFWHKRSLAWEGVSRIMTLHLDLHLQGHSAMILQYNSQDIAHLAVYALQHVMLWVNYLPIWHQWSLAWEDVWIGQMSGSHGPFEFLRAGRGYPSRSPINNFKFSL